MKKWTAVAVAVLFAGASAAFAGGEKCAEQHTQASYEEMAQKYAKKDYLGIEPPVATDMLDYLYARLPSALEDQRAELAAGGDRAEADHG